MPKKQSERVKYRLMLVGGPSDNKIVDRECEVNSPSSLLFVPVPPSDLSENEDDCRWRVGTYGVKGPVDFEMMGVHYAYEFIGYNE